MSERLENRSQASDSIGTMFSGITKQFSNLVRGEIALAKEEAKSSAIAGASSGLAFGAALIFSLFALGWLLTGAYLALALILPTWLAALILGVALLLLAGVLALVGKALLSRMKNHIPRPQDGIKANVETVKKAVAKGPSHE